MSDTDMKLSNNQMSYKRESRHRIFVNKNLSLDKIRFFGFDMDYTLAVYKSPELESLSFDLLKERMIHMGYPKEFNEFKYDPTFPIRGVWIDRFLGNILKMDNYGTILVGFHGLTKMSNDEIIKSYPNKFLKFDPARIHVTNTLYNLAETYLVAVTISYFDKEHKNSNQPECETGINLTDNMTISYSSIIEDIRECMNYVHDKDDLTKIVIDNLPKYVERSPATAKMLIEIKSTGAKTFLLTNSDFAYSEKICRYLFYCEENKTDWLGYFDYVVTSANKPRFFFEGSLMRVINKETNVPIIGHLTGPLESGMVYSGGSVELFSKLIGARGKDVLYFGDHIFGDILKSKKVVGWKTCLIIPELENELYVWKHKADLFERLQSLLIQMAEEYRNLDLESSTVSPNVKDIRVKLQEVSRKLEDAYGKFGSIFRSGSRQTFFAGQVLMYADLYTTTCLNLMMYPLSYMFQAPFMLMPHESTVSHLESPEDINDVTPPVGLRRRVNESDKLKL